MDWRARQMQAQMRREEYLIRARSIGLSNEIALAELQAVEEEAQTTGATVDVYKTAWSRLIGGPADRPTEQLRAVARSMQAACGYSVHPEAVDALAREITKVMSEGATCTLSDEMRLWTAPDGWPS